MTARTHDAFAFASLVTAAVLFPPEKISLLIIAFSIVANNIGGLFPDLDQATNRLWDLLPGDQSTGKLFRKLFIAHRTITHSALGVVIVYFLGINLSAKLFNPQYIDGMIVFWSFMIGFLSHLGVDALTKEGLPIFFPFSWKVGIPPVKALRVTTGTWVENWIVFPLVSVYLVWFIWKYQEAVFHLISFVHRF